MNGRFKFSGSEEMILLMHSAKISQYSFERSDIKEIIRDEKSSSFFYIENNILEGLLTCFLTFSNLSQSINS